MSGTLVAWIVVGAVTGVVGTLAKIFYDKHIKSIRDTAVADAVTKLALQEARDAADSGEVVARNTETKDTVAKLNTGKF